jgi:hypothetical protein
METFQERVKNRGDDVISGKYLDEEVSRDSVKVLREMMATMGKVRGPVAPPAFLAAAQALTVLLKNEARRMGISDADVQFVLALGTRVADVLDNDPNSFVFKARTPAV